MSVVIETTLGDITVDLFIKERPRASLNFLKLCKLKYYNYNLFHTISRDFIAQTGDPTGSRDGGESIYGVLEGPLKRYFQAEKTPRIKHSVPGLVSFVGNEDNMIGSQFFVTLGSDLTYLDERHCVFGEVVEGTDVLELLNETICDQDDRPYQDVRITHTVILDDPFPDIDGLRVPERSPSPSAERLQGGRIAPDEEIDETVGKTAEEVHEIVADKLAKAGATILEMIGDIPDAEMKPPENVLFVCKLNPVTTDEDLNIIFSRFGKINSCEVIRDRKTGESLQYAFVEFDDKKACEDAYFKMDNVLIDDRRIHVDFSQSVAKVKWHGKGRGVTIYDDKGRKSDDKKNDLGKGLYSNKNRNKPNDYNKKDKNPDYDHQRRSRSRSPVQKYRSDKDDRRQNFRSTDYRKSERDSSRYSNRPTSPSRNRRRSRSRSRSKNRDYRRDSPYKKSSYNEDKYRKMRYEDLDDKIRSKRRYRDQEDNPKYREENLKHREENPKHQDRNSKGPDKNTREKNVKHREKLRKENKEYKSKSDLQRKRKSESSSSEDTDESSYSSSTEDDSSSSYSSTDSSDQEISKKRSKKSKKNKKTKTKKSSNKKKSKKKR